METRKRFADEWVNANPNRYALVNEDHIERINDTMTLSNGKKVPCKNVPKHFSELIKLFVEIGYLIRNAVGVKGSPWKWACEYRVMSDIREFPYQPENKIREVSFKQSRVARRRKAG